MLIKTGVLGIFAFTLFGSWKSFATAAPLTSSPYFLTIQLDGQIDQTPDHICLISSFNHPDWRVTQIDKAIGPPDASLPLKNLATLASTELRPTKVGAQSLPPTIWQFDAASLTAITNSRGILESRPYISAALSAMVFDNKASNSCTSPTAACRASFEISPYVKNSVNELDLLHIACASAVRPHNRVNKRVLVLFLNTYTGVHPLIRAITLDGNIVTVRLDGVVTDSDVIVAVVLGGNYVSGEMAPSYNRRIVLTTTPRCHEVNVELPEYDSHSEHLLLVNFMENDTELQTCTMEMSSGYGKINLPVRDSTDPKTLEFSGLKTGLRFVASWYDRSPPAILRGVLRGISFDWDRHCLYPPDEPCPSVRLLDSNIVCRERHPAKERCSYDCGGTGTNVSIHLPEAAQFRRDFTGETWTARVAYNDAHVNTYVDLHDRKIIVAVPKVEPEGFFFTNSFDKIDLLFRNGSTMTTPFESGKRRVIELPDSECGQDVAIHYRGAYPSFPYQQSTKDGVLLLHNPMYIHYGDWRLAGGVGYEMVTGVTPSTGTVVATGGAFSSIGSGKSWWNVDLSTEFTIGEREYYLQNIANDRHLRTATITRILFGIWPGLRVWQNWDSIGVKVGWSHGDARLPSRIVVAFAPQLRVKVSSSLSLSIFYNLYTLEQTRTLDATNTLISAQSRLSSGFSVMLEWSVFEALITSIFQNMAPSETRR